MKAIMIACVVAVLALPGAAASQTLATMTTGAVSSDGEGGIFMVAGTDATINIADAVRIFRFLFLDGAPPTPPGPPGLECGADPDPVGTEGDLGCRVYRSC